MIITALASYYEQLLKEHPDEVAKPGWTTCRIKHRLVISEDGTLIKIIPASEKNGTPRVVPAQEKRTSGVKANFLCDTSAYFFGVDAKKKDDVKDVKEKEERALLCFEASCLKHHELLDGVDSPVAKAILAYFDSWNPKDIPLQQEFGQAFQDACKSGNLAFALLDENGCLLYAEEDSDIAEIWDTNVSLCENDEGKMVCLVTGEKQTIAKLHPSIKGVVGAQSAGASLVSFNSPAFKSYGYDGEQGRNAPVGESVAQAYGLALNYLLSSSNHHILIGDTTVVFWSEHEDQGNTNLFSLLMGGRTSKSQVDSAGLDRNLTAVLLQLRLGKKPSLDGVDFASKFYILGLAPNNARLSVRFFFSGDFGGMLSNIEAHYRRIQLVHPPHEKSLLTPYRLLRAVENKEADNPVVSSELAGPLLKAILSNGKYPEGLYSNVLLRIKASREVSYVQAAIIKGYLIRNNGKLEEDVTIELNEKRCDVAYNLGRAFSYLGQIQEAANGKDTLTGRYLDSACSRPAVVFPSLLKLTNDHLRKLSREMPGYAVNLEKGLSSALSESVIDSFPNHLSLPEQGDFMLGYYHQKAKRYQKKEENPTKNIVNETKEV